MPVRFSLSKDVLAVGLGMCLPVAMLLAFLRVDPPIGPVVGSTDARTTAVPRPARESGVERGAEPVSGLTPAIPSGAASTAGAGADGPPPVNAGAPEASALAVDLTASAGAATAQATKGASGTPATGVTASVEDGGTAFSDGWVLPPPPYFSLGRPFSAEQESRPSRFYPYGTDAGGQYLLHHGVDIAGAMGEPILAVAGGRVVYAGDDLDGGWGPMPDFYGQLVVVEHLERVGDAALHSLYGHVETVDVRAGQMVTAGQRVATVGGRGVALGPHLHLEFRTEPRSYGATLNPELFLRPLDGHGTIVVRVRDAGGGRAPGVPVAVYAVEADGSERWISEVPSYPAEPVNAAWRWDEDAVFGDLPIGRYVVRTRAAFQSSAPVEVRPRGAVLVTLSPGGEPVPIERSTSAVVSPESTLPTPTAPPPSPPTAVSTPLPSTSPP